MKKILIVSLLIISLLLPLKINAEIKISEIGISTNKQNLKVGDEVLLEIKIKTTGLAELTNPYGILLSETEISYDENVLSPGLPSSQDFKTEFYKAEDGKNYLIAVVGVKDTPKNCQSAGVLYCGDYSIKLPFIVRNTEQNNTEIKVANTELALATESDIVEFAYILEEENLENIDIERYFKIITYTTPLSKTIKIEKETSTVVEVEKKSSNSFLDTLEIYNYKIPFNKETKEYEISVAKNVNKIDVRASTEDYKATYKIIGNDDLKSNDYKVTVEVTAEDGSKSEYTIKVNLKEETTTPKLDEETKKDLKVNVKLDKKIIKLLGGIGIGLLLIIIIIVINSIRKKKAINKMFNDL